MPVFHVFSCHNYSKGSICIPGMYTVIFFLWHNHFVIDHIECAALRREHYCLQVKTKDQGQERQYFINAHGDIPPLNFYMLSCFFFLFFFISYKNLK